MQPGRRHRRLNIVLSRSLVETMWERAEQYHIQRGGRFLTRPGVLFLCVPSQSGRAKVTGYIRVHWNEPSLDTATVRLISWNEVGGGSEEEIWQAMELLAGGPIH